MSRTYPEWAFKTSPEQLLEGMSFNIIYSVDVPHDVWIRKYMPNRKLRRKFDTTENDELFEYAYLGGDWKNGKHRKICGILRFPEFKKFCDELGLWTDTTETMGMIGSALGPGWCPAMSFIAEDQEAIQSAYVQPLPFWDDDEMQSKIAANEDEAETAWYILKTIVIEEFGL